MFRLTAGAPALDLRYVIFGGETADPAAIAAFDARCPDPRPAWVNMYGITETTVHVTCKNLSPHDLNDGNPVPIGAHFLTCKSTCWTPISCRYPIVRWGRYGYRARELPTAT
jgi:non-ribosomal peptide synthetase component F